VNRAFYLIRIEYEKIGAEEGAPAAEGELARSFRNLGDLATGVACVLRPPRFRVPAPPVLPRQSKIRCGKWPETVHILDCSQC
jgi:hypothetical protein